MVHFNIGSRHVLAMPGRAPLIMDVPKPLASLPGLSSNASFHSWSRPKLSMPNVHLPDVTMPHLRAPDVAAPRLRMPSMRALRMGTPDVAMPRMPWSDLSMPRMRMPDVTMPHLRTPDISVPRMSMLRLPLARVPWRLTRPKSRRETMLAAAPMVVLGMACGAAIMYFADPQQGRRRRQMAIDRGSAFLRRGLRALDGQRHKVASNVYGKRQALLHNDTVDSTRLRVEDVVAGTPFGSSSD